MCSFTCKSVFQLCLLCFLVCIHHSHQAENLHIDTVKEDHHAHHHEDDDQHSRPTYRVWMEASAAVFLISICGIFGVLVIPIMQKVFYQHLLQFLVALAVGTLSGDALIHLLPHAFLLASNNHDPQLESNAIWMSFFALCSFVVFFLLERIINMIGEWKENKTRRKNEDEKKSNNLRIIRSGHKASDNAERLCKHKYSTYCVTDIDNNEGNGVVKTVEEEDVEASNECEVMISSNGVARGNLDEDNPKEEILSPKSLDTVFVREHEHKHHGHSHAHMHITSKPKSISSVAWMVIFGDGMHNIADGLAIGAAFTSDTVTGIATSIAILCHELPHEIGDFAMLLKAGMSVKQAVFYNVLSSVLAFLGMIVGICLGTLENWTSWIFCATAGIFLYVALVDMVPELNSGHAHPFSHDTQTDLHYVELALQLCGMMLGIGIMLVIALYEHDLKEMF